MIGSDGTLGTRARALVIDPLTLHIPYVFFSSQYRRPKTKARALLSWTLVACLSPCGLYPLHARASSRTGGAEDARSQAGADRGGEDLAAATT
jgi:hypothetical protein